MALISTSYIYIGLVLVLLSKVIGMKVPMLEVFIVEVIKHILW